MKRYRDSTGSESRRGQTHALAKTAPTVAPFADKNIGSFAAPLGPKRPHSENALPDPDNSQQLQCDWKKSGSFPAAMKQYEWARTRGSVQEPSPLRAVTLSSVYDCSKSIETAVALE